MSPQGEPGFPPGPPPDLDITFPPAIEKPPTTATPSVPGSMESVNLPRRWEEKLPEMGSIRPNPPMPIPDDPPPHEGAMINVPLTVKPPDLLIVDVLEALPGRPITGERLVRPDGTITLGFYGNIQVRGLTPEQVKIKVILHLRTFLSDEALGLIGIDQTGYQFMIAPEDSDRVFVDLAAYNSDVYYVQGDIAAPGRLPITGKDTVLDALNYAGGLNSTANPKDIKLIRPARGDKPARVFPIDLEAIQQRGDVTANLQIFPGDRIYVGRDPVVQATVQIDRIAAPVHTMYAMVQQFSFMAKNLHDYFRDANVPPERRREITRRLLDLGLDAMQRKEGEPLDEAQLRALFEQMLELPPIEEAAPANEP